MVETIHMSRADFMASLPKVPEPFLTAALEDLCGENKVAPHEWHAQALEELAGQLGVMNDYYYPLIGAAQIMRDASTALQKIAAMKPSPIGGGFVHGPALLFANCQRFALEAIKTLRKRRAR